MGENLTDKLKNRYIILAMFFILLGVIIILRLINLQIVHGKELDEASQRRVLKEREILAPRGVILDRKGVPIAVNREGFTVNIVNTGLSNDELNDMLLRLVKVLEKNGDGYYNSLNKYLTFNPLSFGSRTAQQIVNWQTDKNTFAINESEVMDTPEAFFKFLRDEKFKISGDYSDGDAYRIMQMRYEILKNQWTFDTGGTICLAKDISQKTIAEVEERHHEFPGVITDIEPIRKYIEGQYVAHILGYVRGIDEKQLEALKDEGYDRNDIIGQEGIELAAERYLRGKDGYQRVEVNTKGRLTDELNGVPSTPGNNIVLTLDMQLQKVAMESLERNIKHIRESGEGGGSNFGDANAGAVVALDVNSGEVLVMASYPSYDPSIFLAGSENTEAQKAIESLYSEENEDRPAFNRAIAGTYAPGSTFKPLTAIAALEEGVITPQKTVYDSGHLNIGGWDFWCLEYRQGLGAHGRLDLKKALETSCNIYFHQIGYETGIDNISKWARYFGLGEYSGIDIPGEQRGIRASKESKKQLHNDIWRPADTAQTAIGQFDNAYTPLQIANYISTLANGGKRYKPYLIKRVIKHDGSIVNETETQFEEVPVKNETIEAVKAGMVEVTHSVDGTAARVFKDFPVTVAGKTGTAETGKEANHSSNALFVCYAPAEKPEIAIAVVVERGVWGSYTAPIARDILEEYFNLKSTAGSEDSVVQDVPVLIR
ncbi:MAG: penicillin-binding protein 2 [Acetivibrionales bacterium]|jgi:penicillin-binding protein 2